VIPEQHPIPGIGMIIVRDGKVLVGLRQGSHGEGTWAFPGGKISRWESPFQTATRELLEETGMTVTGVRPVSFADCQYPENDKHFVTLFVEVEAEGEPELLEPAKCREWQFVDWDAIPTPRLRGINELIESGYRPQGC
jgi:8-oxo-dGTP diphosphatase